MDLSIELASRQEKPVWLVHACDMTFSFSDETSAKSFAAKLEERMRAPHVLRQETLKHWAAKHFRMLRGS
ncbi:MAG: hypothetical protein ACRERX_06155 [Pseudomonas sp.]